MNEQNEQPLDDILADPLADPADEIAALKAERDEFRDKFMRALADAENSRKRADKDRRDAEQYGGSRLARGQAPGAACRSGPPRCEVLLERGDHRVLLALVDLARVRLNALVGGRPGGVVAGDVDVFAGRCLIHLEERV